MFVIVDNESKKFASRNLVFCKLSSTLIISAVAPIQLVISLSLSTFHFHFSISLLLTMSALASSPLQQAFHFQFSTLTFIFHFCFPLSFSLSLSTFTFTHHICCCPSPVGLFCEGLTWSPQRLHPPIPDNIDFYVLHDHSRGWVVFEAFVWTFLQA